MLGEGILSTGEKGKEEMRFSSYYMLLLVSSMRWHHVSADRERLGCSGNSSGKRVRQYGHAHAKRWRECNLLESWKESSSLVRIIVVLRSLESKGMW